MMTATAVRSGLEWLQGQRQECQPPPGVFPGQAVGSNACAGSTDALTASIVSNGSGSPSSVFQSEKLPWVTGAALPTGTVTCLCLKERLHLEVKRERFSSLHRQNEQHEKRTSLGSGTGMAYFIKNMILGTYQAVPKIFCLIVVAGAGKFEAGISENGQTYKHALLTYTLAVKQLIVGRNIKEIIKKISTYIWKTGCGPDTVAFEPVSGWYSDNMLEPITSKDGNASGTILLEALDCILPPIHPIDNPWVYCVLKHGIMVIFVIINVTTEEKSVKMYHEVYFFKDFIYLFIRDIEREQRHRGRSWLPMGSPINWPHCLNHPHQISAGYEPVLDCHAAHINHHSGKKLEDGLKFLRSGDVVMSFSDYSRDHLAISYFKWTIAVVIIKSVERKVAGAGKVIKSSHKTQINVHKIERQEDPMSGLHTFHRLSGEGMLTTGICCRMSLGPPLSYQNNGNAIQFSKGTVTRRQDCKTFLRAIY
ncbi:unnamed protein product [Nyctereutes procyonoides]|uniref:(raccoon dog) hypothetical protein n=1 Tax=Nyctereutes procyonoides TaxID=34880 RepID=A0A811Y4G3_NYCPR|nr:unnamed protein product [Nyctereutes procyonoides]